MDVERLNDLARLSLNQATTKRWTLAEAAEGCARAGIPWIGVWRDRLAEVGATQAARIVRDAGLRVSGLCRGGMFPAAAASERQARIDDNLRAVEEAATIGTDTLVLVCGPSPDRDIRAARTMVEEGIRAVVPYATECGVRLAVEPLHPMFAGDRSVIASLREANDLVEKIGSPQVGVIVDAYHLWWDVELEAQVARAAGHICGYHVSDWIVPLPDVLLGRGMMGDGVIELRRIRTLVETAGYSGPIEVEIFNQAFWDAPGDEVLALMCRRFLACV
jgi:sugar phosphate isomerase/epimerase